MTIPTALFFSGLLFIGIAYVLSENGNKWRIVLGVVGVLLLFSWIWTEVLL